MAQIIYPTSNDVGGGGKGSVHTEHNLAERYAAYHYRNFVFSGYTQHGDTSGLDYVADAGQALISGYHITDDSTLSLSLAASSTHFVFLELERDGNDLVTGAVLASYGDAGERTDAVLLAEVETDGDSITSYTDRRVFPMWHPTKGHTHDGTDSPPVERVAVGAVDDNDVLLALDRTASKGDLLVRDENGDLVALSPGVDGEGLVADPGASTGWRRVVLPGTHGEVCDHDVALGQAVSLDLVGGVPRLRPTNVAGQPDTVGVTSGGVGQMATVKVSTVRQMVVWTDEAGNGSLKAACYSTSSTDEIIVSSVTTLHNGTASINNVSASLLPSTNLVAVTFDDDDTAYCVLVDASFFNPSVLDTYSVAGSKALRVQGMSATYVLLLVDDTSESKGHIYLLEWDSPDLSLVDDLLLGTTGGTYGFRLARFNDTHAVVARMSSSGAIGVNFNVIEIGGIPTGLSAGNNLYTEIPVEYMEMTARSAFQIVVHELDGTDENVYLLNRSDTNVSDQTRTTLRTVAADSLRLQRPRINGSEIMLSSFSTGDGGAHIRTGYFSGYSYVETAEAVYPFGTSGSGSQQLGQADADRACRLHLSGNSLRVQMLRSKYGENDNNYLGLALAAANAGETCTAVTPGGKHNGLSGLSLLASYYVGFWGKLTTTSHETGVLVGRSLSDTVLLVQ